MGDLLKAFGITIAFVVPGALMLLIGAFGSENVLQGLRFLGSDDMASVGPIILLIISIALGLTVHVAAWLLYEVMMVPFWYGLLGEKQLPMDFERAFASEHGLKAFNYINEQTYRYHQFFGSLSIVAFALTIVTVEINPTPTNIGFWSFCLGLLLGIASIKMMLNNHRALGAVFPLSEKENRDPEGG
ncbi:MAG: hypothetical protein AAGF33_08490 [Pseudomonadota bacterium]